MKISELLTESIVDEAETDPSIRKILQQKGYKYLGAGVDQTAYLAPDGMILKIFGTSRHAKPGSLELTKSQKTFKAYADYCKANPDNQFLPQFSDWAMFQYKGKPYLQIKMERLFPFNKGAAGWNDVLEAIADRAAYSKQPAAKKKFLDRYLNQSYDSWSVKRTEELLSHLGDEGFNKLWDTIYDLRQVSKKIGLGNLDLHSGNFMLGSDGEIVISDPFFAGWNAE